MGLQSNKTTGISRVSADLLKQLVPVEFGLQFLCDLLNAFHADPTTIPLELDAGWVILIPKKALVDQPDHFRPIVCGEVLLKVLSKLVMTRIVQSWSLPTCCFGACRGRGVAEALYTVKACAQETAGLQDNTIFLQLDVASAFDCLQLRAILDFFRSHWAASTAKSCKLLHWILSHSELHFQLFDSQWRVHQEVGTQQGASHSPLLFGRMVAAKFDELCRIWETNGEIPAFRTIHHSLWGICPEDPDIEKNQYGKNIDTPEILVFLD